MRIWDVTTGAQLASVNASDTISCLLFTPDGKRLITGARGGFQTTNSGGARIWGVSNAQIYRNRLAASARRTRIGPLVEEWLTVDLAEAKSRLVKARETMEPEDWHEAENLILMEANRRRRQR